jgi:cysteine desulfurase / selenocysteine lyase
MTASPPLTNAAIRTARSSPAFDVDAVRADFPILHQKVHGHPLAFLDNAASSQRPRSVIEEIARFDSQDYANIHRGVHELSQRATKAYEAARDKVQRFINARSRKEIIFVRGTTEAINLVASSFGRPALNLGDEVVLTRMEHHSNIVPWQMVCRERGAVLRVAEINDRGELDLDHLAKLLGPRTKLLTLAHVSNALGTINPVKEIIALARRRGIPVLLDGAQAVPHMRVDVQDLDCDFYAFSSHKMFGPTGIGVLYGKEKLLESMPPYQGGGDMISVVTFEKTFYNGLPAKFEAGTPNITGVVGLGAAIDYLERLDWDAAMAHEHDLLRYGTELLEDIPEVTIVGTAAAKASVLSFLIEGIHPHDAGTILDRHGVAVRAGHHCAQPVMQRFSIPATTRASLAFYNNRDDVEALARAVRDTIEVFK